MESGGESGEPIGEVARHVIDAGCGDFARQPGEGGDADAAFLERALEAAEDAVGAEEGGIDAADAEARVLAHVGGTVVRGENDQGFLQHAGIAEGLDDRADVAVQIADHGGVARAGAGVGKVAGLAAVGGIVPIPRVFVDPLGGRMHGHVGLDEGQVEEEGALVVFFDEGEGFAQHVIGRVLFADPFLHADFAFRLAAVAGDGFGVEGDFPVVAPEVGRVERVGQGLAVVAEEEVEALAVGIAGRADRSEAPFAEGGGGEAGLLEHGGEGGDPGGERVLALAEFGEMAVCLDVSADFGVAEVAAGHEDAARRRADRSAGVVAGEAGAFGGELVEVRGADFFLSVAAEFAVAEVVRDDEDQVFRGGGGG